MAKESQRFAHLLQMAGGEAELFEEDPEREQVCRSPSIISMHPSIGQLSNSLKQARTEAPAGRL
jgi:hypothetical protein